MTTKIKLGDLTLRQFRKIFTRPCPFSIKKVQNCKECKEKYNADYVICQLLQDYDINFDLTYNMLDQEVEYDESK